MANAEFSRPSRKKWRAFLQCKDAQIIVSLIYSHTKRQENLWWCSQVILTLTSSWCPPHHQPSVLLTASSSACLSYGHPFQNLTFSLLRATFCSWSGACSSPRPAGTGASAFSCAASWSDPLFSAPSVLCGHRSSVRLDLVGHGHDLGEARHNKEVGGYSLQGWKSDVKYLLLDLS